MSPLTEPSFYDLATEHNDQNRDSTMSRSSLFFLRVPRDAIPDPNPDPDAKGGGGGRGGGSSRGGSTSNPGTARTGMGGISGGKPTPAVNGYNPRVVGGGGGGSTRGGHGAPSSAGGGGGGGGLLLMAAGGSVLIAAPILAEGDLDDDEFEYGMCGAMSNLYEELKNIDDIGGVSGAQFANDTVIEFGLMRDARTVDDQQTHLTNLSGRFQQIHDHRGSISKPLSYFTKRWPEYLKKPDGNPTLDINPEGACSEDQPELEHTATSGDLRNKAVEMGDKVGKGLWKYQENDPDTKTTFANQTAEYKDLNNVDFINLANNRTRSFYDNKTAVALFATDAITRFNATLNSKAADLNGKQTKALNSAWSKVENVTDVTELRYLLSGIKQYMDPKPETSAASSSYARNVPHWLALASLTAGTVALQSLPG